ncbi:hypothetical protein TRFO_03758 [Tritrichomonas foetus]|uniref:Uncharacterized protein n=1 Tax=Tritrichomonas foetus TaxID=1144522 RepID=A0A1J4KLE5_9EUKA|nr:hypothetical protein TRFO_03758 [Tritrichomonas foetus]|eukprot:OHT12121.1 hypothetical protein TRFO_03758 [Tritrichomonas foetus]
MIFSWLLLFLGLLIQILYFHFDPYNNENDALISVTNPYLSFCLIFNHKVWKFASVAIGSIIMQEPSTTFIFHIINPISDFNDNNANYRNLIVKLKNMSYDPANIKFFFYSVNESNYIFPRFKKGYPLLIMTKLYLSEFIADKEVVYVDSDILALRPLSSVYKYDLNPKKKPKKYFAGSSTLDMFPARWINSGFIYYNLDWLRKSGRLYSFINCTQTKAYNFYDDWCHTYCFPRKEIITLPYAYNLMIHALKDNETRPKVINETNDASVAHFMHRSKKALTMKLELEISNYKHASNNSKSFMRKYLNVSNIVYKFLNVSR